MANIRYRSEFYSDNRVFWRVDILDMSHTYSTPTDFVCTPPFFSINYTGSKERFDPILGSVCKVNALIQNSTDDALITDIIGAAEQRFFVKIYRSISNLSLAYDQANCAIWWTGVLLPDLGKIEDIGYPYEYEISFTDGLGSLKDIDFLNNGVLYAGRETFIAVIIELMSKTGIMGQFSSGDTFLKTCVHWYDTHHVFSANHDPLLYSTVDHGAFYKFEDNVNKPSKCFDILVMILEAFGARILQAEGFFHILQVNELINNTLITRSYYKSGALKTYSTNDNYRTTVFNTLAGGFTSFYPALKSVTKIYNYRQSPGGTNLLPVQTSYDPYVSFLNNITGGNGETLHFTGGINQVATFSSLPPAFYVKYALSIVIIKEDNTPRYLYNGSDGADAYTWTTNSSNYCQFWAPFLHPQYTFNQVLNIAFTTGVIPWNATGLFRFWKVGFYDVNKSPITLTNYTFSFTCIQFNLSLLLLGLVETEGKTTFEADNVQISSFLLKFPDTSIGDGPNAYSLGRIMASNGITWTGSTSWSIKGGSEHKNINQLMVNEVLKGQQTPCDKFICSILSTTHGGQNVFIFNSKAFQILNATFSANNDTWQGEWFKINLLSAALQTGLQLDPDNYDAEAEWYLQNWDTEDISESAITTIKQNDLSLLDSSPFVDIQETLLPFDLGISAACNNLDLIQFNSTTGKWENHALSALGLLSLTVDDSAIKLDSGTTYNPGSSAKTISHSTAAGYKHLPSNTSATKWLQGTTTDGAGAWTTPAALTTAAGKGLLIGGSTTGSYDINTTKAIEVDFSQVQAKLTNPVTGTGTHWQMAYWDTSGTAVTGSSNFTIDTDGNVTCGQNLTITGNLTINGTTTTVNTATLSVDDPLISLAVGNVTDVVDIGIYGAYKPSSTALWGGLFRDASDGVWKFFKSVQAEPTTVVNESATGYAYADIKANTLLVPGIAGSSTSTNFTTWNSTSKALEYRSITNMVTGSDTSGDVAFWSGTYSLSGDSNFYWDNTNKRLGIGTTSPTQAIDINSGNFITTGKGIFAQVVLTSSSPTPSNGMIYYKPGTSGFNFYSTDATNDENIFTLSNATNQFGFYLANTGTIPIQMGSVTNAPFGFFADNGAVAFYVDANGKIKFKSTGEVVPVAYLELVPLNTTSTDLTFAIRNHADNANLFTIGNTGLIGITAQLTSTLAIGTSPFAVTSTTLNTNLNADLLDGHHWGDIPASQIQSDWNQTNNVLLDYIKNKPSIPAAQVNSDWNASTGVAQILNKPYVPGSIVTGSGSVYYLAKWSSSSEITNAESYHDDSGLYFVHDSGYIDFCPGNTHYFRMGTNGQLYSYLTIGTSPFAITSTTVNTNLNADLLDGNHAAAFEPALGNPGTNGYVLSSTTAGVRSWVAQSGGGGYWSKTGTILSPTTANDGIAVYTTGNYAGDFEVTNAGEEGAEAVYACSIGTNSGTNYAFFADASGAASSNFSFYGNSGILYNAAAAEFGSYLQLAQISAPSPTTDRLYNVGGSLYWHGSAIGGGIGGSGTAGYIPYFSASSTIANSTIYTDGTNMSIGNTTLWIPLWMTTAVGGSGGGTIFGVGNLAGSFGFGCDASGGYAQPYTSGKGMTFYDASGIGSIAIDGATHAIMAPTIYSLTVGATNRDVYVDSTGKLGYVSSSRRYKENIMPMENVDWIYKLETFNCTLKSDITHTKQYVLLAEDVEKVNKSFVSYDQNGRPETVLYTALITPMLKVIQEQKIEIESLNKRIEILEKN